MFNIAISNLAWSRNEDQQVFELMRELEIFNLEISPFRTSSGYSGINEVSAKKTLNILKQYGISAVALQSLFYRYPDLSIFKENRTHQEALDHFGKIIHYMSMLGGTVIVFGSPKNKKRDGMNYQDALKESVAFFTSVAQMCENANITLCLEPTPDIYNADFIRTMQEAIKLIGMINSKYVKLNLDIGSLKVNNESFSNIIHNHRQEIGHIHISEPYLKMIVPNRAFHEDIASQIKASSYQGVVSIEMLPHSENNLSRIFSTLSFIKSVYL